MLDHEYYSHAASRLRRWARQGTWRRMVHANAIRSGHAIIRPEPLIAHIVHQLQCLSKTMAHSNPSR